MDSGTSFEGSFLIYLGLVTASAVLLCGRFGSRKIGLACAGGVAAWIGYAFVLGRTGVVANYHTFPPGIALLLGPVFLCVLGVALSPAGRRLAIMIPLSALIGFQAFRIGVEFYLFRLYRVGLAPRLLTLGGGNFEIVMALSAPLIALLVWRGSKWWRIAVAWNLLGLVSLANVATRAVLSAPGPLNFIHTDVPDTAILTYPFTFIPGFMAPLAVMFHILAIRSIADGRASHSGDTVDR